MYVGAEPAADRRVHAQVTSAYLLFIPIPGNVDLDRVVNRMLLATAKALGADKVVNIQVDITPDDGIWTLRKLIGWRQRRGERGRGGRRGRPPTPRRRLPAAARGLCRERCSTSA